MSDDTLQVELVAADRLVWSGEAKVVNARTAGGEIGILANHMPVLSLLEAGVVEIETADGETHLAAVDDGQTDDGKSAQGKADDDIAALNVD